ncbi:MAG: hypothetical protein KF708_06955 [Pirellulales bacterium]|nr:hypothetical protein [Pirellulales bacterium]
MITQRDGEILEVLARRVRLMSACQAASVWWPDQAAGSVNAFRRLRRLVSQHALLEFHVLAQPLLPLHGPLYQWRPEQPPPDFLAIERLLRVRWHAAATRMTVFVASPATLLSTGVQHRPPIKNHCQVTHDLHVTQVYLRYRLDHPELASGWLGEDELAPSRRDQILPDAVIADGKGDPCWAVEFGGKYRAERLERFHVDCEARRLPYELW